MVRDPPGDGQPLGEGSYRIGNLLGGKDKWWCLNRTYPIGIEAWKPTSYDDSGTVLAQAVANVTDDFRRVFGKLDVQ